MTIVIWLSQALYIYITEYAVFQNYYPICAMKTV